MSERAARSRLLKSALCLLLLASGAARAQTQEPPEKPPRLKRDHFGKSLERLRWDAEQKRAVEAARAGAKKGEVGEEEEDEVVRVETSLVVCDVLVLDSQGRAVTGLGREDFLITEDGRPQEVGDFALGDSANVPRSIVLILDYSGSMRPFIANSVLAAKLLVDQLNPRDRMALVTDNVELLVDFTRDKEKLRKKLDDLKRKAISEDFTPGKYGKSLQYSALMATLRELFDEEDTRPIVIFQTDGDELSLLRGSSVPVYELSGMSSKSLQAMRAKVEAKRAQFSIEDVFQTAERSRATIYTVIPGVRLIGLEPGEEPVKAKALRSAYEATMTVTGNAEVDALREPVLEYIVRYWPQHQLTLDDLSKLTGGRTSFLEKPSQATGVYADIFNDIGRRYVVGFYPTNKERDGKRRRVQIDVRGHPEYTVWGRKSYYAPKP
ncbi:MAG: VWA domain-containing protein [Pyrinomonadaceae bacterium]